MGESSNEKKSMGQKCSDGCTGFYDFLYQKDPQTEVVTVMGRTGRSWAKIGLFYLVFYGFLAAFFSAMLAVFLTTINSPDEGGPKLTQFLKNQPGLTRLDQSNILLVQNNDSVKAYIELINTHLNSYNNGDNSGKLCNVGDNTGIPKGEKFCIFNTSLLQDCAPSNKSDYGIQEKKPCIFIKVNKVYDWVPESKDGGNYLTLKCENPKAMVYPDGFLLSAFPFRGEKDYKSPVVAVKIDVGETTVCYLEGKDIEVSSTSVASRAFGKIKLENVGNE